MMLGSRPIPSSVMSLFQKVFSRVFRHFVLFIYQILNFFFGVFCTNTVFYSKYLFTYQILCEIYQIINLLGCFAAFFLQFQTLFPIKSSLGCGNNHRKFDYPKITHHLRAYPRHQKFSEYLCL